jgi:hypothetical protein
MAVLGNLSNVSMRLFFDSNEHGSYTPLVINNASIDLPEELIEDDNATWWPIKFETPTSDYPAEIVEDFIYVNVSASEEGRGDGNVSVFIDFDNSLVSWYRMDDVDGAGNPIDYMNRNNGTKYNLANYTPDGAMGAGFVFGGSGDYIDIGQIELVHDKSFSISAWVLFYPSDSPAPMILAKTSESTSYKGFGLYVTQDGKVTSTIHEGHSPVKRIGAECNNTIEQGVWKHLTVSYDGSNSYLGFNIYIDGQNQDTTNMDEGVVSDSSVSSDVFIGGRAWNGITNHWNGTIDDVMIFNRSLSEEEVLGLYANSSLKYLSVNFTDLVDGIHVFKAYSQDTDGNVNSTEIKAVETGNLILGHVIDRGDFMHLELEDRGIALYMPFDELEDSDVLIIDNLNESCVFTGEWANSTSQTNHYASNYQHDMTQDPNPTKWATYTPNITEPGEYDVYEWHVSYSTYATAVPIIINHADGTYQTTINQRLNSGKWNYLGTFNFSEGTTGNLIINASASGITIADAIMFARGVSSAVIRDYSTNNNSGTLTNSNYTSDGYIGGAIEFNGSGYMDISGIATVGNTHTIAAWIKTPAHTSSNWRSIIDSSAGRVILGTYQGTIQNYDTSWKDSGLTWKDDGWSFVAMVKNGTDLLFFVDGNTSQTSALERNIGGTTTIGSRYSKDAAFWEGKIDEVTIFDRALTIDELSDIYNNTYPKFYGYGSLVFQFREFDQDGGLNRVNITIDSFELNGTAINKGRLWHAEIGNDTGYVELGDGLISYLHLDEYPTSIIVDNTDDGCVFTGTWVVSTWQSGFYGANYRHDDGAGSNPSKIATYTPNISEPGEYEVFERHPANSAYAGAVPIKINHADGTYETTISQKINGGKWNYIGTFNFSEGTSGNLIINASATGNTIADAVRFAKVFRDSTGNGLHGRNVVNVTQTQGRFNNSLAFSGDDYIDIGTDIGIINKSGAFSAWFKTESSGSSIYIMTHRTGTSNNRVYMLKRDNNLFSCGFGDSWGAVSSGITVNDNRWHHGVVTWNLSGAYCYLDGVSVGEYSYTLPVETDGFVNIGTYNYGSEGYWVGEIDEVMIFNRTLLAEEVYSLYISGSTNFKYNGVGLRWSESSSGIFDIIGDTFKFEIDGVANYVLPEIYFYSNAFSSYSPVLIDGINISYWSE